MLRKHIYQFFKVNWYKLQMGYKIWQVYEIEQINFVASKTLGVMFEMLFRSSKTGVMFEAWLLTEVIQGMKYNF